MKLFILGNGFDLKHKLPTQYNPDFYNVARWKRGTLLFGYCFNTEDMDLWNNFEKSLSEIRGLILFELVYLSIYLIPKDLTFF